MVIARLEPAQAQDPAVCGAHPRFHNAPSAITRPRTREGAGSTAGGRGRCRARSGTRGIALLLEQGFEQAPQLAVTRRLPTLVQVVGKIQLGCAALSNIGAAHVDVGPSMLDVKALAVGV